MATLNQVTQPSLTGDGQHGFDNRALVQRMRALLEPGYSPRQATYDLRRLRRKQLIERIPGAHSYQLTQTGRAVAVLFTKAYGRILGPGLAALDPGYRQTSPGTAPSPLPGNSSPPNSTSS